jgi:AcrR family transcriptional regulator
MPKIISDLRETLYAETRRQLNTVGYTELTMRSIAKACGIAVGTLYNYFPSKEYLVGCVVLEDWAVSYRLMESGVARAQSVREGIGLIYGQMLDFIRLYDPLFRSDPGALKTSTYSDRHEVLLKQIRELLARLTERFGPQPEPFTLTFLAESILRCCVKPYSYEELWPVLEKILR